MLEELIFKFRYVGLCDLDIPKLFANIGGPDQTPRSAAPDLGLHCLSITHLGVSRLQWVNKPSLPFFVCCLFPTI